MNRELIKDAVVAAIKRLSNADEVSPENSLEEIGITSLRFIRLVIDIEKRCNMRFDDADIDSKLFMNVSELINYISLKLNTTEYVEK